MDSPIVLLVCGFFLLGVAGEALLRGAVTVARVLRVPPLVIGLTIIAFGTSAPELTVSLNAALAGQTDISIGNVVGSNIANILLVLGIMAAIRPFAVDQNTLARDGRFMLLASLGLVGLSVYGVISMLVGGLLLIILLLYSVNLFRTVRSSEDNTQAVASVDENNLSGGLWVGLLVLTVGLGGIVWGADLMVEGAVSLARAFGLSEAVIALSIVAIGTSLPELAVSIVASLRGHAGLAVGNIIGSNISNILLILGGTALLTPLPIPIAMAYRDVPVMFGVAVIGVFLMTTGRQMSRAEGGGCLALYVAYISYIYLV